MKTSNPTAEGLVVIEKASESDDIIVEEIGKLEKVIYRYVTKRVIMEDGTELRAIQGEPSFLLEQIAEIEAHCEELAQKKPTPIELPLWRWNRKAAHRRFRRLIREFDWRILELSPHLRAVASRILESGSDDDNVGIDWASENLDKLDDYLSAKRSVPILVVSDAIPAGLKQMILEAQEAYFWGLQRAVAALCRSILEETAEQIESLGTVHFAAQPLNGKAVLAGLPDKLLPSKGRMWSQQIWDQGNRALHESEFLEDTWETLIRTLRIVEAIANRGGLTADGT